ncbi:MAG: hypothetical protein WBP93_03450 [Pyrinomonadaceae bacterium]
MTRTKLYGVALLATLAFFVFTFNTTQALAQTSSQSSSEAKIDQSINLDTQLHLIVGTNESREEESVPPALEPVIKQLRQSLPFKHYHVAATLLNRVKNDGRLNLRWVGGPLLTPSAATASTPSFNEFSTTSVRLFEDAQGHEMVRMSGFYFGARIPIQTSSSVASNGVTPVLVVNYENTGVNTDISMRLGEPVVVGTLNVGPSGDAIIIVVSAKKTSN